MFSSKYLFIKTNETFFVSFSLESSWNCWAISIKNFVVWGERTCGARAKPKKARGIKRGWKHSEYTTFKKGKSMKEEVRVYVFKWDFC